MGSRIHTVAHSQRKGLSVKYLIVYFEASFLYWSELLIINAVKTYSTALCNCDEYLSELTDMARIRPRNFRSVKDVVGLYWGHTCERSIPKKAVCLKSSEGYLEV